MILVICKTSSQEKPIESRKQLQNLQMEIIKHLDECETCLICCRFLRGTPEYEEIQTQLTSRNKQKILVWKMSPIWCSRDVLSLRLDIIFVKFVSVSTKIMFGSPHLDDYVPDWNNSRHILKVFQLAFQWCMTCVDI